MIKETRFESLTTKETKGWGFDDSSLTEETEEEKLKKYEDRRYIAEHIFRIVLEFSGKDGKTERILMKHAGEGYMNPSRTLSSLVNSSLVKRLGISGMVLRFVNIHYRDYRDKSGNKSGKILYAYYSMGWAMSLNDSILVVIGV
jgi:hypothetical protein